MNVRTETSYHKKLSELKIISVGGNTRKFINNVYKIKLCRQKNSGWHQPRNLSPVKSFRQKNSTRGFANIQYTAQCSYGQEESVLHTVVWCDKLSQQSSFKAAIYSSLWVNCDPRVGKEPSCFCLVEVAISSSLSLSLSDLWCKCRNEFPLFFVQKWRPLLVDVVGFPMFSTVFPMVFFGYVQCWKGSEWRVWYVKYSKYVYLEQVSSDFLVPPISLTSDSLH